jgi:hypothetical protein
MFRFSIALVAAVARGLIAKTAALALEPALTARFPALPHWACAVIALVAMVIAVEALALLVEWLIEHFGHHE